MLENLDHNWDILQYFKQTDYLFVIIGCYFTKWNFLNSLRCIKKCNTLDMHNIIWLCNNLDHMLYACEYGFDFILCNQNAFINITNFNIIENQTKVYDLVLNTRPVTIKNTHIAKDIDKLAIIKGYDFNQKLYYDLYQLNPLYINNNRLEPNEVNNIMNQSICGGIFSLQEGACYSSSEYILSGIPVISTHSKGGREIWYNIYNSIIIDLNTESLKIAISYIKTHYDHYNKYKIRQLHIDLMTRMRYTFVNKFYNICSHYEHNCNLNDLFANQFTYKPIKRIQLCDAIALIK